MDHTELEALTETSTETSYEDKPQSQHDIGKAFNRSRFPRLPWALLLVIYAPVGLFLTLLRVCMSFQAILLLLLFPKGALKRFLVRVFFGVLGIIVITDSFHRKGAHIKVFISNRLSFMDHVVLHLALDCVTVSTKDKTPPLRFLFPHRILFASREEAIEIEAKEFPEFDESRSSVDFAPFVFQPEPMPTNGVHMLLKFSLWPCSLDSVVQPVALSAVRPLGIKLTSVGCWQWWDLFWILFVPVTVFRVKVLPPMERRQEEEAAQLSRRVQLALAEELDVLGSEVTADDITTWMRGVSTPSPTSLAPPTTDTPPQLTEGVVELESMVRQVSAVMPQVPSPAIRRDLAKTGSVDATITNLLEGLVPYDPLPPPQLTSTYPSAPAPAPPASTVKLKFRLYTSPAMNAMHRQISFDERKRAMLENARRRYIEKQGLDMKL